MLVCAQVEKLAAQQRQEVQEQRVVEQGMQRALAICEAVGNVSQGGFL